MSQTTTYGEPLDPTPLWDPERTAAYLCFEPDYVRKLAGKGVIPAKKVGKYWRFVPAHVIAWAESTEPS